MDVKEIEPDELSSKNGKDSNPVWVACDGKVYDLSGSKLWRGGSHMGSHIAGADLSGEIDAAPHGREMLERYPQIGVLSKQGVVEKEESSERSYGLLIKFPFLRRHPHPMTVHFPIVYMFSAAALVALYLISGVKGFETASYYCLGAGLLFIPVAMVTGYFTWWLNYAARPMKVIRIKQALSAVLLGFDLILFLWRTAR